MAHDGSKRTANTPSPLPTTTTEDEVITPHSSDHDDRLAKISLRGMIWHWNTHRLNVSLINQIEFRDSKVFTMIVESFTPSSKLKLLMTTKFSSEIKETRRLLEASRRPVGSDAESLLGAEAIEELSEAFSEEELSESYCLAAYGVSKILKAGEFDVFMASAFILHSIVLKHIPLSQRRLPLITFDEDFEGEVDSFLTRLSDIFRSAIVDPKWQALMEDEEFESDAIDLIDGRLLRVIMQAMCDNSLNGVIPRASQPDWALLSGIVMELAEQELSLQGSIDPEFSKSSAKEADFEPEVADLAVLPFTNSGFDKHLECIRVTADSSLSVRFGAMKIYRETSHWHNHNKPLNPKHLPAQKVSKWRYVQPFFLR